jgi:hypothetical protein
VEVYLDSGKTTLIGSCAIDAQGNWSIQTGQTYIDSCYVAVFGTFNGVEYEQSHFNDVMEGIYVSGDDVYVDDYDGLEWVRIFPRSRFSGTVNLTVDGVTPDDPIQVIAKDTGSGAWIGSCFALDGNWLMDMSIDHLSYSGTVSFILGITGPTGNKQYIDTGISQALSASSISIISDIALNVPLSSLTLSGTVTGLYPDIGLVDDYSEKPWRVFVYDNAELAQSGFLGSGEIQSNGAWSLSVLNPGHSKPLYFTLGTVFEQDGERRFQSGLAGSGNTNSPSMIALAMPETSIPLSSTGFDIAYPDQLRLFKVLPGAGTGYTFTITERNVSTHIYLYSGTGGDRIALSGGTQITETLSAGTPYYVLVGTYSSNINGTFTLEVTSP